MNKIIRLMHKEITAKLFLVIISVFTIFSCKKKSDDEKILSSILSESNFSESDSLFFNLETNNKRIIEFFRYRNTKNTVFRYAYKEDKETNLSDSVYYKIDSVISYETPIIRNYYVKMGKGVNKLAETFLKDSFNYTKEVTKKWALEANHKIVFTNYDTNKKLDISVPVYNLKKDKAIVYETIHEGQFVISKIYLLKKTESKWETVFKEVDSNYYFN